MDNKKRRGNKIKRWQQSGPPSDVTATYQMMPLILRIQVFGGVGEFVDVPITPQTTCRDVIECAQDPGDSCCHLVEVWRGCERRVSEKEYIFSLLRAWGHYRGEVRFQLRYPSGPRRLRDGMKEPTAFPDKLGVGGSLSFAELRSMAGRQQDQIERQAQILLAREQRLKFLRNQEVRSNQLAASKERLTALHQRVDQQEAKLRRLRALRGQVENTQGNNNKLSSDLECVKSLFNEKEKELSLAVARVEELTRQLEELKRGRLRPNAHINTSKEIQRLRQELLYRSQLSAQQSSQLLEQRSGIATKRDEVTRMDRRIAELQQRLARKRQLNQQLTQQISARQAQPGGRRPSVATVEPYQREDLHSKLNDGGRDDLGEFLPNKHDPKYQTLPYNTKFHATTAPSQESLNDSEKAVVSPPPAASIATRGYSSVYSISSAPPSITVRSQPVGGTSAPTQEGNQAPPLQNQVTSLKGDVLPPTPLTAPAENGDDSEKPALPPKPPLPKPLVPPRQSFAEKVDTSPESVDSALCVLRGVANSKHPPVHRFANRHLLQSAHGYPGSENAPDENDKLAPNVHISINRRIEMPPAFLFPEPSTNDHNERIIVQESENDVTKRITDDEGNTVEDRQPDGSSLDGHNSEQITRTDDENGNEADLKTLPSNVIPNLVARVKKGNLKSSGGSGGHAKITRRVSFDPLALMLDASLEGELELVKKCASEVVNPSAANDEGITALHNAVCAGHYHIVKFLVEYGCDVNAQDSDGWTPLHCAASCNNLDMLEYLVERGACIFATTLSDHDTAADKCEEDEIGFQGCSQYLYNIQEKLGIMHNGIVYALYTYDAQNPDELSFQPADALTILRKGDEAEKEWWWAKKDDREGYVPRNLFGLYPRYKPPEESTG